MPPLHPALVHFPIALVSFSFITDLLGRLFNRASLRSAGFWTLIGALLGGAGAAASGYFDSTHDTLGETMRYVDFHETAGWILVGALVVLTLRQKRSASRNDLSSCGFTGRGAYPVPGLVRRRDGLFTRRGSRGRRQRERASRKR